MNDEARVGWGTGWVEEEWSKGCGRNEASKKKAGKRTSLLWNGKLVRMVKCMKKERKKR